MCSFPSWLGGRSKYSPIGAGSEWGFVMSMTVCLSCLGHAHFKVHVHQRSP